MCTVSWQLSVYIGNDTTDQKTTLENTKYSFFYDNYNNFFLSFQKRMHNQFLYFMYIKCIIYLIYLVTLCFRVQFSLLPNY